MKMKKTMSFIFFSMTIILLPFIFVLTKNPSYEQIKKRFSLGKDISKNSLSSKSNIYFIIDYFSKLLLKSQPFPEGVETVDFCEHINAVQLEVPKWEKEGLYEVSAQTREGMMYPAFLVYNWYAEDAPTIIFNHGAFEYPFDKTFLRIFNKDSLKTLKVNLIIIRTPFHQHKGELKNGIKTLSKFLTTMAVSTKLTEEVLKNLRTRGVKFVEVAGISLGGVISNRHRIIYNSADVYVPIIAGTAHEKLFIRNKDINQKEIDRNKIISQNLNFSAEWNKINTNNVFPICARYDDYCRLNEQGPSYGNCKIEIWNLGHLTTAVSYRALKPVLLRHLDKNEKTN